MPTPRLARTHAPALGHFTREEVLRLVGITPQQITRWERLRGGVSSVTPLRALTPDTPHNGTVVQFCLDGIGGDHHHDTRS